jgi:hypothetical protein
MDDAGAGEPLELGGMVQERVEERSRPIAAARVDHQAGGLVDHQHVGVLVDDGERDRLGAEGGILLAGDERDLDRFAALYLQARRGGAAVDPHVARGDQARQPRARLLREQARERLVEPQPGELGRNGEAHVIIRASAIGIQRLRT